MARLLIVLLLPVLALAAGGPVVSGPVVRTAATTTAATWGAPVAGVTAADVMRAFEPPPRPWSAGHRGVDLAAPGGEVLSPAEGTVRFVGAVAGRDVVTVAHPDGLVSSLEPVSSELSVGQRVRAGQSLGTVQDGVEHCPVTCVHWGVRVPGGWVVDGAVRDRYVDPLALLGWSGPSVLWPLEGGPPVESGTNARHGSETPSKPQRVPTIAQDGTAGTSPPSGVGMAAAPFLGRDDYPYRMPGDVSWKPGSRDPGADPWGMYKRECVSFVAWRLNQLMGWKEGRPYPFSKTTMNFNGSANATHWGRELGEMGYTVDQTPTVGSVAWWQGGRAGYLAAGHVAIVLAVNDDGTVLIEQYNGGSIATSPTKASYSQQVIPAKQPSGYIHVADVQGAADGSAGDSAETGGQDGENADRGE